MKDEPEFKPLQVNPAFFLSRDSRAPFQIRQKIQGPSHIPTAEGKLLLRYFLKSGIPLQLKTGNLLSCRDDMGCMELSSSSCAEIGVPIDLRRNSGVLSSKSRLLSCLIGNTELLCTQCRRIGPHLTVRGKPHGFFTRCVGNLGYILELQRGWPFKTRVCSATSGLLSSCDGQLRNLN